MPNIQELPVRTQLSPIRLAKKICVNNIPDPHLATREINGHMNNIDALFRRIKGYITRYGMGGSTRARIASNISYTLGDIIYHVDNARGAAGRLDVTPKNVDIREVIRDLEKLEIDGTISFDRNTREMVFTSDDIVLEEVEFGRFEIRIPINLDMYHMRTVAITPNFCPGSTHITHPHVLGDNLCLGAGQRAVRLAFLEGRILDIIELVNSILGCYNCADAHQMIQEWKDTVLCADCGEYTLEEYMYDCDGCENIFCSDCVYKCESCGKYYCSSCIYILCDKCDTPLCNECANKCCECQKHYCSDCMSDNERNNYCDSCQATINGSKENEEANTQVQPDCVGQTTFFER